MLLDSLIVRLYSSGPTVGDAWEMENLDIVQKTPSRREQESKQEEQAL